eukprot:1290537-Pyramimonas_sp.AAC.1
MSGGRRPCRPFAVDITLCTHPRALPPPAMRTQTRQHMKSDWVKVFPGTACHSLLEYFGGASIPRSTARQQSFKKILEKGCSWVTIYTQVDVGLVINATHTESRTRTQSQGHYHPG